MATAEARSRKGAPGLAVEGPQVGSAEYEAARVPDLHLWHRDLAIFVASGVFFLVVLLGILAWVLNGLTESQMERITFPTSLQQAQALGEVLSEYTEANYHKVMFGHAMVYIYLQTYAIPGTVFINLLGGALLGMWVGFPLCLCYNTIGSIFLYWWSQLLGKRLVLRFFPKKLDELRDVINEHRNELTVYMIFMRIFPFTPNWFMNISSPQLKIPVRQFAPGVFFGLIPYNFLSCKAGLLLSELRSKSDIIDTSTTVQLALIAVIGFVAPILWKKYGGGEKKKRT